MKNQGNGGKIIEWIIVILILVIYSLYKLVPTARKVLSLDNGGRIFTIVFSAVILSAVFISKAIEKNNVQNHMQELNDGMLGNEELERKKEEYMEKHGYDKKIGSTIIDDLTKRYRKEAILPFWIAVFMALLTCSFYLTNDTSGTIYALIFTALAGFWAIYKFCAVPVKTFKKQFNVTSKIPLAEEDYMNGKLICKNTSGINIGNKLFAVCFTPKSILIFPIGYIQNVTRCILYNKEKNRGFLGSKKIEYRLLLNINQPAPKQDKVYNLEFYIPLDKVRLEIAYDALKDQRVPYEREYKYIENK